MGIYRLKREQFLPVDLSALWDFISDPGNLAKITPGNMKFRITTPDLPSEIYPGMMVSYRVSPFPGFRVTWVTEITHVTEGRFFVDEQRKGPYRLWHHEHRLRPVNGGTEMEDVVTYIPPMGILGSIANFLVIEKKLRAIFDYRETKLRELLEKSGFKGS